jgi:hypothetical protein
MSLDIASTELLDVCEQFAQVTLPDNLADAGFGDLKNVKAAQDALEDARRQLVAAVSGRSDVESPPLAPSDRPDPRVHALRDGSHVVASRTTPGVFYRVADLHCSCRAGLRGIRCWHVAAVREVVKPERRPAAPTRTEWFE